MDGSDCEGFTAATGFDGQNGGFVSYETSVYVRVASW